MHVNGPVNCSAGNAPKVPGKTGKITPDQGTVPVMGWTEDAASSRLFLVNSEAWPTVFSVSCGHPKYERAKSSTIRERFGIDRLLSLLVLPSSSSLARCRPRLKPHMKPVKSSPELFP
jgi:hypothetical protein